MITCPWCGTNYVAFQPNCGNCGGALPLPPEMAAPEAPGQIAAPPPPPREMPRYHAWRLLATDGGAIAGGILLLLGGIFAVLGLALTIAAVTAFVGIPFGVLGVILLLVGGALVWTRYRAAAQVVDILRTGDAALGVVTHATESYHVQINGRFPWTIGYRFQAQGRAYEGQVTTLSRPEVDRQPGKPVYVLYRRDNPTQNTIYPNPYGYYGG